LREFPKLALNLTVFLLVTYALIILQASFRPFADSRYFFWMPATLNWLPVIVYLSLYRKPVEGILSSYFLLWCMTVLTISNVGFLWLTGLAIFIFCQAIKSRLFWNGSQYFCFLCFLSVFVAQITQFLGNLIFYDHLAWPNVFIWILQAFVTLIPAWLCFYLLNWLDRITHKESLTEVAGGGLA
jgi:hypothetical protein